MRLLTHCGEGTVFAGSVDRRANGASISIGDACLIQGQLVVERDESRISVGNRSLIGGGTVLDCALEISVGDDVLISYGCVIADSDNHSIYPELRVKDLASWMNGRQHDWTHSRMAPIRIDSGAWIGARSIILKGVTIGAGSVVGMGSVVTRDVPPRVVVAGIPAVIVREIEPLKVIE
jgi:acetyltransferase-like isoleucine patch superfamily enzyme